MNISRNNLINCVMMLNYRTAGNIASFKAEVKNKRHSPKVFDDGQAVKIYRIKLSHFSIYKILRTYSESLDVHTFVRNKMYSNRLIQNI